MQSRITLRCSAIIPDRGTVELLAFGTGLGRKHQDDQKAAIHGQELRGLTFHKSRSAWGAPWEHNMEPRRWLPYRNLHSRHLGLALATARVVAWIGILLIAAGIAYGITAAVSHAASVPMALGMVIGLIGYGLAALALSGALAALVGIEETLRRRNGGE